MAASGLDGSFAESPAAHGTGGGGDSAWRRHNSSGRVDADRAGHRTAAQGDVEAPATPIASPVQRPPHTGPAGGRHPRRVSSATVRRRAARAALRLAKLPRHLSGKVLCLGGLLLLTCVWQLSLLGFVPPASGYGSRLVRWLGSFKSGSHPHHATDEEARSVVMFDTGDDDVVGGGAAHVVDLPGLGDNIDEVLEAAQKVRLGVDSGARSCRHSVSGRRLAVDDLGRVCARGSLNETGCCDDNPAAPSVAPSLAIQHTCDGCDVRAFNCCTTYEACVACCTHPDRAPLRDALRARGASRHPIYRLADTAFDLCAFKCRTSSGSVVYENSYRSGPGGQKHCFGGVKPALAEPVSTMNSIDETYIAIQRYKAENTGTASPAASGVGAVSQTPVTQVTVEDVVAAQTQSWLDSVRVMTDPFLESEESVEAGLRSLYAGVSHFPQGLGQQGATTAGFDQADRDTPL